MFNVKGILIIVTFLGIAASFVEARQLHHRLGRFLQTDPLDYVDGLNQFQYVRSVPTFIKDPLGLYGGGSICGTVWCQPPYVPQPQPPLPGPSAREACIQRIFNETLRRGRIKDDAYNADDWMHCVASCRIAKECDLGTLSVVIGGTYREACQIDDYGVVECAEDTVDNFGGLVAALGCIGEGSACCECECDYVNGPPPGPPP